MEYLQYSESNYHGQGYGLVLNLIINGIPSIPESYSQVAEEVEDVLNLIINGIPSIPPGSIVRTGAFAVLNLIINGIPSIRNKEQLKEMIK